MESSGRIDQRLQSPAQNWRDAQPRAPRGSTFEERLNAARSLSNASRQDALAEVRTLVRAIESGVYDPARLTDLIFYARHPNLHGVPLTGEYSQALDEWNAISANLVQPTLNDVRDFLGSSLNGRDAFPGEESRLPHESVNVSRTGAGSIPGGDVHEYDGVIERAVEFCPGLHPALLKGLLAQESNFNPTVINQYGYTGIAQFGIEAAREVGLRVGVSGGAMDERLNPSKAIPAAARLLNLKAVRLSETAFARFGQPRGIEFWKFVLAAYNGGEGTVALAMSHAYRAALNRAGARGLVGTDAINFARAYATQWENLKLGGPNSPLGLAAARYFPTLAEQKFREIGNYPTGIVARAGA